MREGYLDALATGSAQSAGRVRDAGVAAGLVRETKGKRHLGRRVSPEEVATGVTHWRRASRDTPPPFLLAFPPQTCDDTLDIAPTRGRPEEG
jgi:hypothetical protein